MNEKEFYDEHLPTTLGRDLARLLIGDMIGRGQFRQVFAHAFDKRKVVKIENGYASFSNVRESDIWKAVEDVKEHARWFAPVYQISGAGCVLVMARTQPVTRKELPDKVPAYFTDLKPENWGKWRGRVVCHDYGNHRLLEQGMTSRMRKADWDR